MRLGPISKSSCPFCLPQSWSFMWIHTLLQRFRRWDRQEAFGSSSQVVFSPATQDARAPTCRPTKNESTEEGWASAFRKSYPGDCRTASSGSCWSRAAASFLGEDTEDHGRRCHSKAMAEPGCLTCRSFPPHSTASCSAFLTRCSKMKGRWVFCPRAWGLVLLMCV